MTTEALWGCFLICMIGKYHLPHSQGCWELNEKNHVKHPKLLAHYSCSINISSLSLLGHCSAKDKNEAFHTLPTVRSLFGELCCNDFKYVHSFNIVLHVTRYHLSSIWALPWVLDNSFDKREVDNDQYNLSHFYVIGAEVLCVVLWGEEKGGNKY